MKAMLAAALAAHVGILLASPSLAAQEPERKASKYPPPRHFEIQRATSPIHVDADLSEPAWQAALSFDVPFEYQPADNLPAPVATEFLATYDDKYFYAAWRCHDPNPRAIRAHLMDRDDTDTLVQDDHVVLMLDPWGDGRRGFQFRVNPLGIQADAIFGENEGVEDFSFDMIWDAAAKITPDGYTVEIAIPLSQLRFPRTPGKQTWGIDVGRSYPRDVRHRLAAHPRDLNVACTLCQIDKVTGFENLTPGRHLEITPTLTGRRTDEAPDLGEDLRTGKAKAELGASLRWGITPNISFNAAINPDFSQVEADVAQLAANERFALFFPEKRPFFLEGLDLFSTPIAALFTRNVADPDWGLKLTGKEEKNAFGVFLAQDPAEAHLLLLPSNQETASTFLDEAINSSALRYRRDFGASSAFGFLYTGREGSDYYNRVAGADGAFHLNDATTLKMQALASETRYPTGLALANGQPRGSFSGHAIFVDLNDQTRDWTLRSTYEERSAGFRADSGFVPRVDFRDLKASVQRQLYGKPGAFLNTTYLSIFVERTEDMQGRLTDQILEAYAIAQGPLQSTGQIYLDRTTTRFAGRLFEDMDTVKLSGNFQPSGAALLSLDLTTGKTVDFANVVEANLLEIKPSVQLKLGQHLKATVNYTQRQLTVDGQKTLDAGLSELRLAYNWNVRSFTRVILQYLDQNPGGSRTLFSQLLYSYKLNPQTVLFLGYSDNRAAEALRQIPMTQTDRTFFLKVGYAFTL